MIEVAWNNAQLQRPCQPQCIIPVLSDQVRLDLMACHAVQRTGDLEQIQLLLGHASIQTTERYLGTRQDLINAVNDNLGIDLD